MFSGIFRFIKLSNILLDICLLNLALFLTFYLGVNNNHIFYQEHKTLLLVIFINTVWLLSAGYFRIYRHYSEKSAVTIYQQMIKAYFLFAAALITLVSLLVYSDEEFTLMLPGRNFFFIFLIAFFVALVADRLLMLGIRKNRKQRGRLKKENVIVVGGNDFPEEMKLRLLQEFDEPLQIVGFFYNRPESVQNEEPPYLYKGSFEEVFDFLSKEKVDQLFCIIKGLEQPAISRLMEAADNHLTRFKILLDTYDYLPSRGSFQIINDIPIFQPRKEPLQIPEKAFTKRLFDLLFSIIIIVLLLSWLLPILAILIKLDSRGRVFFKQKRVGKGNKPFNCLKLRSMYVNEDADRVMASKNDKRVTKIGTFLRKNSLDELPQFFNVFIGDMSVVGPRPHMMADGELYAYMTKKYMIRHFLRPGITGWAQITASRAETRSLDEVEKRVRADVWYMENWSFLLDVKIIFLTFLQLFRRGKEIN